MRLSVERDALAAAVKRASGAVMSRNVIPILACVHIKAADNTLRITGTNMDEWVAVRCEAAVADPGTACVDAALLSAWLQASPKGSLVSLSIVNGCLVAVVGRATGSFVTLPHEEYPTPEKADKGVEVPFNADALATCLPFASTEQSRYTLQGVAISHGHAAAFDGHRFCGIDIGAPEEVAAIIPSFGVRQIVQFGPDARLWIGESFWRCEEKDTVAGGKLIDGTFPDWRGGLPVIETMGSADADDLAAALRQVLMAADGVSRAVNVKADGEEITLRSSGAVATATGSAAYDGPEFEMTINGKYAETALSAFTGGVVSLMADYSNGSRLLLTGQGGASKRVLVAGMRA